MENEKELNKFALIRKVAWGSLMMACVSSINRNNINLLFASITIIILNRFYVRNTKYFGKVLVHYLFMGIGFEVTTLVILNHYFFNQYPRTKYWVSKDEYKVMTLLLSSLETITNCGLLFLIVKKYLTENSKDVKYGFKFDYLRDLENFAKPSKPIQNNPAGNNIINTNLVRGN